MEGRMKRAAVFALLAMGVCCFVTGCTAPAEPCRGIAYRVTGGKNDMVLLGSIHIGNEEMQHYDRSLTEALNNADAFVFECDNESQEAVQSIQDMMKARKPLSEEVGEETYAMLTRVTEKLHYSLSAFEAMRPWAVTSTLSTKVAAAELGVSDATRALSYGVEKQVRAQVKERSVLYLETAQEQLQVMDDFSPALQEELLRSACGMLLNPQPTSLAQWPDWWREGNSQAFAEAYSEETDLDDPALAQEYHLGLVTERNQRMACRLKELLEDSTGRSYFVTVGLLHLVLPEDSVVELLRDEGYRVEVLEQAGE